MSVSTILEVFGENCLKKAFRTAREVAWKHGFDVGWEPQTVDTNLAFNVLGSGGRAVNIQ